MASSSNAGPTPTTREPHPRGTYGQLQDDLAVAEGDLPARLRLRASWHDSNRSLSGEAVADVRQSADEIERLLGIIQRIDQANQVMEPYGNIDKLVKEALS